MGAAAGVGVEGEVAVRDLITIVDIRGTERESEGAKVTRDIDLFLMTGILGDELWRVREQEPEENLAIQTEIGGQEDYRRGRNSYVRLLGSCIAWLVVSGGSGFGFAPRLFLLHLISLEAFHLFSFFSIIFPILKSVSLVQKSNTTSPSSSQSHVLDLAKKFPKVT